MQRLARAVCPQAKQLLRRHGRHGATRLFATVVPKEMRYSRNGKMGDVLETKDGKMADKLGPNEVAIEMLCASINMSMDSQRVAYGKIPRKTGQPVEQIAGIDGVGRVIDVGSGAKDATGVELQKGDAVIPGVANFGTYRTHASTDANNLISVHRAMLTDHKDAPIFHKTASMTAPCTAYRMLHDFVDLKQGDVVWQNVANGLVGQVVTQICRDMGVKCISVLRGNIGSDDDLELHKQLGSFLCVDDSVLNAGPEMKNLLSDLPAPKLILNGAGGRSATNFIRYVPKGASPTFVTYGTGKSNEGVTIPTSAFLEKDINFKGFNFETWMDNADASAKREMVDWVSRRIIQQGLLWETWECEFDTDKCWEALRDASKRYPGHTMKKLVMKMPDAKALPDLEVPIDSVIQEIQHDMRINHMSEAKIDAYCQKYLANYENWLAGNYTITGQQSIDNTRRSPEDFETIPSHSDGRSTTEVSPEDLRDPKTGNKVN